MKTARLLFFISMCVTFLPVGIASAQGDIFVIQLDDATINPVTADYIIHAIDRAQAASAECLIIKLDTPGGLLSSTRSIVKKVLASEVPVVVYIYPGGARAGSAGVFITYASHVAAMAPSTNIGAAHPVQIGGRQERRQGISDILRRLRDRSPQDAEEGSGKSEAPDMDTKEFSDDDSMGEKVLQDTVAFIKAIAEKRNRNIEWAEASVTRSSSITEREALKKNVIEIIARDEQDLINQLDGRVVATDNRTVTLRTRDAAVRHIPMDMRQRILNVLANPNIAYIFMILGFYGLLYEITHPGIGVPGVMGAIFLILAFYSMQTLPTNYAGLALIILSVILFIAEAYVPGFGLLTLGGLVCMVLGSLLLFESIDPIMRVSITAIVSVAVATAIITVFLARGVFLSHRQKIVSGQEGLIEEEGEAYTDITPVVAGKVFVHGELWNATADEEVRKGDRVRVCEVKGLSVKVRKS